MNPRKIRSMNNGCDLMTRSLSESPDRRNLPLVNEIKGHPSSPPCVRVAPGSRQSLRSVWILISLAYGNFWIAACVSLQAPFFPLEAERKGASSTEYGLIFGVYEAVICVTAPMFGKLIGRVSPNFLIECGLFVAGIGTILFGVLDHVPSGAPFIGFAFTVRIVEGIGASAFMTACYTVMAAEFPERIATTFALLETAFGLGLILGPTVGGALYELGGYVLPFALLGTLLLMGTVVTLIFLPVAAELTTPLSVSNMFLFLWDFGILLDALSIVTSLNFIGFNAATLEPHLRQFAISPLVTGLFFVLTGAIYAFTSPLFGKMCDKGYNPKIICLAGCVLSAAGSLFIGPMPFFPMKSEMWLIIVALLVIGLGIAAKLVSGFVDALQDTITRRGFADDLTTYGMVSAMFFSSCSIGAFLGPSIGGYLLEKFGYRYASLYILLDDCFMIVLLTVYFIRLKMKGPQNLVEEKFNCEATETQPLLNCRFRESMS